jgi:hypothetical protein
VLDQPVARPPVPAQPVLDQPVVRPPVPAPPVQDPVPAPPVLDQPVARPPVPAQPVLESPRPRFTTLPPQPVLESPKPRFTTLPPQLHISTTDDEIIAWARDAVPMLQGKQQHNFCQLLRLSRVDPMMDIHTIEQVQLIHGQFLRMTWHEGRSWQRATLWDESPDADVLSGAHATTATGAVSILRDRFISKMDNAGVYALMTNEEGSKWLNFTVNKVAQMSKNLAGVVMEIRARCTFKRAGAGGYEADAALVRQLIAAHQSKSNHSRWCVPEPFVEFVGIWVPLAGKLCDELPGCRQDR